LCGFLQVGDRHDDLVSQSPAGVWKSDGAFVRPQPSRPFAAITVI
jgi:hypothetical protein